METRVAITNLITRFPNLRLAVEPADLQVLPVPFKPAWPASPWCSAEPIGYALVSHSSVWPYPVDV